MDYFSVSIKNKKIILALGAESDGNFSVYQKGKIYPPTQATVPSFHSGNHKIITRSHKNIYNILGGGVYFSRSFGDLLKDTNFNKFKNELNKFFKKENIKPEIIITDLHPLYKTTFLGQELAKKFKAKHIQVQHHLAHIFSAIGEKILNTKSYKLKDAIGVACDGTGYGTDGKIWGGEVFKLKIKNEKLKIIERIGHLEDQMMIGGDLAVREPARMLIAILAKIKNQKSKIKITDQNLKLVDNKNFIYSFISQYYTRNEFELLYNQLQQNFNCVETSSAGRVLDAVSVLLGFAGNKRNYKHEATELLEKNSAKPYELPPLIRGDGGIFILQTTLLFEYLIKNLHKDKRRLAATAQLYIAQGLYEIIRKSKISAKGICASPRLVRLRRRSALDGKNLKSKIFLAGGLANNKIISSYLESKGVFAAKKIYPAKSSQSEFNGVPRGDAGLSFGQIIYHLSQR